MLRAPYLVARLRFVRHDTVCLTDKDDISRGRCWTDRTICCAFAPDEFTCVRPEGGEIALAVGQSGVLTLPRLKPGDSRFLAATYATAPRRFCPNRSIFLAALWSLCRLVPHSGQVCQRMDKPLETTTPQPEHVWLVNAGLTAITERPAHAAL